MKYNTDLSNTLNLENKGIVDVTIPELRYSNVIKVHIPLEYLLNGKKEEDTLEIIVDEAHPAYNEVLEEYNANQGILNMEKILQLESINIAIEEFFNSVFKEMYRE
jgi:hypothetical protein